MKKIKATWEQILCMEAHISLFWGIINHPVNEFKFEITGMKLKALGFNLITFQECKKMDLPFPDGHTKVMEVCGYIISEDNKVKIACYLKDFYYHPRTLQTWTFVSKDIHSQKQLEEFIKNLKL